MLLRITEDHLGKVLEVLYLAGCHSFLNGAALGVEKRHEGCGAGLLIPSDLSLCWPPSRYECAPELTGRERLVMMNRGSASLKRLPDDYVGLRP